MSLPGAPEGLARDDGVMRWRIVVSDPWEMSPAALFGEGTPGRDTLVVRLQPGSTLGGTSVSSAALSVRHFGEKFDAAASAPVSVNGVAKGQGTEIPFLGSAEPLRS